MTLKDKLPGRFLPFFIILPLKQDVTLYTIFIFIIRVKGMHNWIHFKLEVDNLYNSVLKKLHGWKAQFKYQTNYLCSSN